MKFEDIDAPTHVSRRGRNQPTPDELRELVTRLLIKDQKYSDPPPSTSLRMYIERELKSRGLSGVYRVQLKNARPKNGKPTIVSLKKVAEDDAESFNAPQAHDATECETFAALFALDILNHFERAIQNSKQQAQALLDGKR